MRLVIRIGGSIIASPPNTRILSNYATLLRTLIFQGHQIITVVGGGTFARNLIALSSELGLDDEARDWVAIQASRVIAQILAGALGNYAIMKIPESPQEAARVISEGKVAVMGGLRPGMTTDTVAVLVANEIRADLFIKATDQEGVFTKDPRKYPEAVKIDQIAIVDLRQHLEQTTHQVGMHQVLDPKAVELLTNAKVTTVVLNGSRPENIELAVKGEKIGTLITY